MPCNDSSSSILITLDIKERFLSFEFAKITCGREIAGQTKFCQYLTGKTLDEIMALTYEKSLHDLQIKDEESKFILYLEWDALRSAVAQYLGRHQEGIDFERCQITSISENQGGVEIAEVILPPKEMPRILPCHFSDTH